MRGVADDITIGVILTLAVSTFEPLLAAAIGGLTGYIFLHKMGEVEFSFTGLIWAIFLGMVMGYISLGITFAMGYEDAVRYPISAASGLFAPRVLRFLYSLSAERIVSLMRKLLKG